MEEEIRNEEKEELTLYEKLARIQSEFHLAKNEYSEYGGFYYRSLEAILAQLKPLLLKYKIFMRFEDDIEEHLDRAYLVSKVIAYDLEIFDEGVIVGKGYAREAIEKKKFDDSQLTGSATTYARKEALSAFLLFQDEADADQQDGGEVVSLEAQEVTDEQRAEMAELGIDIAKVAIYYRKNVDELTYSEIQKAINIKKGALK